MAQTIVTPTCSASPAAGGTCTYALGTSGSYDYPAAKSAWQNYTYTATPAPGYRFLRFEITVTEEDDSGGSNTGTTTSTNNPDYADHGEDHWMDGSAWWWSILSYPQSEAWISAISVVAVFEKRNSGQLVYSTAQNGQLVYSEAQGGALVYDG